MARWRFLGGATSPHALKSLQRSGRKDRPHSPCRGDLPARIRNADDREEAAPRAAFGATGSLRFPQAGPPGRKAAALRQAKKAREMRSFLLAGTSGSSAPRLPSSLAQSLLHLQIGRAHV